MKIWKQVLLVTGFQELELPIGAKLLDVQMQAGQPCLWYLCNEKAGKVKRQIAIYGTGHTVPDDIGSYIASFQMLDGQLVWHVFELN